jgi:hypothetical protein
MCYVCAPTQHKPKYGIIVDRTTGQRQNIESRSRSCQRLDNSAHEEGLKYSN